MNGRMIGRQLLDFVYPRHCLGCEVRLTVESPWRYGCEACVQTLPWVSGSACSHCGAPFEGDVVGPRQCPGCIELKPAFAQGKTVFRFEGLAREWVHGLKYRPGRHLVPDLLKIVTILPEIKAYLENSILVPVPLYKTRERQRGYNQSLLIAVAWAKGVPGVQVEELLIRLYSTQSQTELSRAERLKNVKNAFAIRPKVALNPALLYTVIDDVYTTGATLNACAKVLYRAGAERIQVLTLAHG